jgi:hypothetical protein
VESFWYRRFGAQAQNFIQHCTFHQQRNPALRAAAAANG